MTIFLSGAGERAAGAGRPGEERSRPAEGSTDLRRVRGPVAEELYLACRPRRPGSGSAQAEEIYAALVGRLAAEGMPLEALVWETLFVRRPGKTMEAVVAAREQALRRAGLASPPPVTAVVGQPPLDPGAEVELAATAVRPLRGELPGVVSRRQEGGCGCEACACLTARVVRTGGEAHLFAGEIYGAGSEAFEQTFAMFEAAEALLHEAGMAFRHVARTWIHLRNIDRDYEAFNRGRREFFRARGIERKPASTAVGGEPRAPGHDVSMRLYAIRSGAPRRTEVVSAPTLNEAWTYGSDFSRGLTSRDDNKIALFISGTASIDEAGRTAHVGDFDAQADRMLVNIAALLDRQEASFRDVVSAVAYVKRPDDAPRLRAIFRDRGFEGFPCNVVAAAICRPELLCETEALAIRPHSGATRRE